jgi:hypothetical protein
MSLDRKDVRAKLDPEYHEALTKMAAKASMDIGEFIERELVRLIDERLHAYIKDEVDFEPLGLTGKIRESLGAPGRGGAQRGKR